MHRALTCRWRTLQLSTVWEALVPAIFHLIPHFRPLLLLSHQYMLRDLVRTERLTCFENSTVRYSWKLKYTYTSNNRSYSGVDGFIGWHERHGETHSDTDHLQLSQMSLLNSQCDVHVRARMYMRMIINRGRSDRNFWLSKIIIQTLKIVYELQEN